MAVLADDDVVVHSDPERTRDGDDRLRHLDVGARGGRVAGRMVVYQDHGGRGNFERAFDHLARVDRRVVDGAFLQFLVGDELVLLVEEERKLRNSVPARDPFAEPAIAATRISEREAAEFALIL